MSRPEQYWKPVIRVLKHEYRRMGVRQRRRGWTTRWNQLLTIPVVGYLEDGDGPEPFRDVAWVEVSTEETAKWKLSDPEWMFRSVEDDLVGRLATTPARWTIYEGTWEIERKFSERPVRILRILNPFVQYPGAK